MPGYPTLSGKIRTIGSLGVLLQAKRAGLVTAVRPLIDQISDSPVFLSDELIAVVLDLAGEVPFC